MAFHYANLIDRDDALLSLSILTGVLLTMYLFERFYLKKKYFLTTKLTPIDALFFSSLIDLSATRFPDFTLGTILVFLGKMAILYYFLKLSVEERKHRKPPSPQNSTP